MYSDISSFLFFRQLFSPFSELFSQFMSHFVAVRNTNCQLFFMVFCRFIHFSQNIRLSFALCKSQNSGEIFVDNVDNSVYNRIFPVFKLFYVWITEFVFHSYRQGLFSLDENLCIFHNLTVFSSVKAFDYVPS